MRPIKFEKEHSWPANGFRKLTIRRRVLLVGFLLPLALDVNKVGNEGYKA